ncbi:membrane protein insertion efficiency factor YidD [Candidatus Berkelbacteria bacterium CG_4_10_14_0_8_um_filter_35_9_33_8]|uniref:Membrane protein insertion efficiency factor YidD n=1 Tax=Candidatus Berkelbacteria bacterium CG_4_10_14_0_2_um_filter_35_9_33_12 TaxID=1974499 RepID=A0A2M7W411_9BACT|nr:MAG: membrane protein insertion efficiency factor YidD [Candidatus Berkelbacteria bacterium CG23_combo_of_CG06-09_8_20_14_all_33_15]PIS08300.1 MAG: membrane protein insertion efficiency factor YidD [Candidatus Berkelbacteria bacterium CG10_big_fil_rev_8_21_14_0_10_33_10]PIZ28524.1 MAG: membrane protein insertion efficiency factor YidD [Candidatus Berkelbacteria bacterium CG_4_10_14_0_8_um_filter_35_9_33_8]PJA20399.1 MAG: membrane protein insertion efficiency factor YidD [Candidatus Berkelbact
MFRKIILKFIGFYQKTLSPDKGYFKKYFPAGYCPFTPHCSDYCYQAVEKYGSLKGLAKCAGRVVRCHPWTKGGKDPV